MYPCYLPFRPVRSSVSSAMGFSLPAKLCRERAVDQGATRQGVVAVKRALSLHTFTEVRVRRKTWSKAWRPEARTEGPKQGRKARRKTRRQEDHKARRPVVYKRGFCFLSSLRSKSFIRWGSEEMAINGDNVPYGALNLRRKNAVC